jgi:hypothetical protein
VRVRSCPTRGTRVVPVGYLPPTVSFCAARENILPSHKMYDNAFLLFKNGGVFCRQIVMESDF